METTLTDRQKVLLATLNKLGGRAQLKQIIAEPEVNTAMTDYKANNLLHNLFLSKHVAKEWPNWYLLTEKGKANVPVRS